MITIGVGNTGSKLALLFDKKSLLISTASQDTRNFKDYNVFEISENGASKRFKTGTEIWKNNKEKLKSILDKVKDQKVVIFSSFGGGSGSSSLSPISEILLSNNNKILIVGVLPFKGESNPPLANSVQSVNSLFPLLNKVTIMIFDNTKLVKNYDGNWNDINKYITRRVDYMVNLLTKFNTKRYSPITIDQSELDSVIFGGGFLDFSENFIEEDLPKFEYGKIDKTTKNCLISMFVDDEIEDEKMEDYHKTLTSVITKMSKRVPNSRIIPGIVRASINSSNSSDTHIKDRAYFVIASGLNPLNYISKLERIRDAAIKKASAFNEKQKADKVIGIKDSKLLDI